MSQRNNKAFWEDESDPDTAKHSDKDREIPSISHAISTVDGNAVGAYDRHVSRLCLSFSCNSDSPTCNEWIFHTFFSSFKVQRISGLNFNDYATRKTIAQGMLDLALLTANAAQLKRVLQLGKNSQFYTLLVTLITISICLQVVCIIHTQSPRKLSTNQLFSVDSAWIDTILVEFRLFLSHRLYKHASCAF